MPVIGDNVFIGAGAKLIGEITIGDGVFIGVNAIVTRDIPSGSRVLCTSGIEVTPRPDATPASPSA
jgi:serine O-acetyltransferase